MSRQHHYLKCICEFYQATEQGEKMFEVRKNDRNYQVGDMLYLEEITKSSGESTNREQGPFEVVYILHGGNFGIKKGYCVMQLK